MKRLAALGAALFASALPANRELPGCATAIALGPRFFAGAVTDGGLSPDGYFRAPKDASGRPRFVLLVGAPGSGKSRWARAAKGLGWTFVTCDEVRLALLREWGLPADEGHLFRPDVVDEMIRRTQAETARALAAKEPIVVEAVGVHLMPLRAARMSLANRAGYSVEGLVFAADGSGNLLANVALRTGRGGTPAPADIVRNRFRELAFYGSPFRVDPGHRAGEAVPEVAADFEWLAELARAQPTLAAGRATLAQDRRGALDRYLAEDVFHRVDFVWVPNFALSESGER